MAMVTVWCTATTRELSRQSTPLHGHSSSVTSATAKSSQSLNLNNNSVSSTVGQLVMSGQGVCGLKEAM